MKKCYILFDDKWSLEMPEEETYSEEVVHIYSSYESAVADAYAFMNEREGQNAEVEEKSNTRLILSFEYRTYYGEIWQCDLRIEERNIHDTSVKDFDV